MQIQLNSKNCLVVLIGLFFLYLSFLLYFRDSTSPTHIFPNHFIADLKDLIGHCIVSVEIAGQAIVRVHSESGFGWKKSKSLDQFGQHELFTKADLLSHHLIMENLARLPGLTIISEEKSHLSESTVDQYRIKHAEIWHKYKDELHRLPNQKYGLSSLTVWVDPLDATKEFTENLLQYVTVMICIAVDGKPIFGVIHRPFSGETVWGIVNHAVYPAEYLSSVSTPAANLAIISKSHSGRTNPNILNQFVSFRNLSIESAGGAGYKTLRVMNGTARLYPHWTRGSKKWDICAPTALVLAAGGQITDLRGEPLNFEPNAGSDRFENGFLITGPGESEHFKMVGDLSKLLDQ